MSFFCFYHELGYSVGAGMHASELPIGGIRDGHEAVKYLASGIVVVAVPGLEPDPLSPSEDVPGGGSVLTDGVWMWPAIAAHLVAKRGVAIPEPFYRRMKDHRFLINSSIEREVAALFQRALPELSIEGGASSRRSFPSSNGSPIDEHSFHPSMSRRAFVVDEVRGTRGIAVTCVVRPTDGTLKVDELLHLNDSFDGDVRVLSIRTKGGSAGELNTGMAGIVEFDGPDAARLVRGAYEITPSAHPGW